MVQILTNKSEEISLHSGFQNGNSYVEVDIMYNDLSNKDKLKFDKFIILLEGSSNCTIDTDKNLSVEINLLSIEGQFFEEMYSITYEDLSITKKNIIVSFIELITRSQETLS